MARLRPEVSMKRLSLLIVLCQRVAVRRRPVGGAEHGGSVVDAAVAVSPQGTETAREECDSAARRPGGPASERILSRRQFHHGVGARPHL